MRHVLTDADIQAIEKAVNAAGSPRVEITVKNGKIAIYQVNSKKVN